LPDALLFLESRPQIGPELENSYKESKIQATYQVFNYRVPTGKMALARNLAEFPGDPPVENQQQTLFPQKTSFKQIRLTAIPKRSHYAYN